VFKVFAFVVTHMKRIALASFALLTSCTYSPRPAPPSTIELTEVARFEQDQVTGVALSKTGRVFVSFPNWHDGHRIHVAEVDPESGNYWPYPDEAWNAWTVDQPIRSGMAPDHFVCVQAVYVDDHDRLWVLDTAAPRMQGITSNARPKLVRFDLSTNAETRSFFFDNDGAPPGAYLNDVRIDTDADRAYITDSSLGGLVVLDISTGIYRRVLTGHPSTMAEPDVVLMCEGKELRFAGGPNEGKVPQVHSDGIALDMIHGYLHWQALTSRTLYRIPTSVLGDFDATEDRIAAAVERVGTTVATDGMEIDARGNLYFSDFEHDAIVVRSRDGTLMTYVTDPRLSWPDSFAFGPDNSLYVTSAQIHRTAWFNRDGMMPMTPYRLFRLSQYGR
jgi:sugar lactone lactonase YvrE